PPAAVRRHAAILGDGHLGVLHRLRREKRIDGARDAQAPVGVETLAPFGLIAKKSVLGQRGSRRDSAKPEREAAGESPAGDRVRKSGHILLQYSRTRPIGDGLAAP